jgi:hypothetical protein
LAQAVCRCAFVGSACFLVVAGIIEGFLSPSETIPASIKFGTGISTGIAMYSYLFLVGRENSDDNLTANKRESTPDIL